MLSGSGPRLLRPRVFVPRLLGVLQHTKIAAYCSKSKTAFIFGYRCDRSGYLDLAPPGGSGPYYRYDVVCVYNVHMRCVHTRPGSPPPGMCCQSVSDHPRHPRQTHPDLLLNNLYLTSGSCLLTCLPPCLSVDLSGC